MRVHLLSKLTIVRKHLFTLTLSLLFAFLNMAQTPGGQGGAAKPGSPGTQAGPGGPGAPGGAGARPAPPSIGRAYGKVTDSAGQPMGQVSALVLRSTVDPGTKKKKLVLIKGVDTKANGEFDFEDLPIASQLVLKLSATGYKAQDVSFMIIPAAAVAKPGDNASPLGNLPSFNKNLALIKFSTTMTHLAPATVPPK